MYTRWRACCSTVVLVIGALLTSSAPAGQPSAPSVDTTAQEVRKAPTYTVTSVPVGPLSLAVPKLPDLSGYTAAAVQARIQRDQTGRVTLRRMLQQDTLKQFVGGNNRLAEWVRRQRGMPQAIFIEGGYVDLATLAKKLPKQHFNNAAEGIYLARLPIVVAHGATLHIDRQTLRLSQERGAFLINDGKLFVTDSKIIGWREKDNAAATLRKPGEFRPFVLSWGGTETYIVNSFLGSLGYNSNKSYGMSLSQHTPDISRRLRRAAPTGWLLDSEFADLWFGFYCYEAKDVVLKGNTYRDSQVYGIDPHDRSQGLVIANNTVSGTREKHGIIISREVDHSWIFNNQIHDNQLSGIVLDRNSRNNLVAYNEVYENRADGITLYESSDNLLWGNRVIGNARHGIRLRNSVDIRLYENFVVGNGLSGVYGHTRKLTDKRRNLKIDPYDTKVSMTLVGGQLSGNGSTPLTIDSPLSIELYRVDMALPGKSSGISLSGILGERQNEILDLLVRQRKAVRIGLVESQAGLQD
ncbi:mannuronan 5-epimerase AlgG [Pseudomonas sp. OTU5201]|uniref:mannuronan 5-epimerase AlgG n=1 Tax=Pseudomonas sp. OTU5201 TaxID=3043850 RepID=UPI00313E081F